MNESIRMQENPFDLPNVDIPDPIDSVFPLFLPSPAVSPRLQQAPALRHPLLSRDDGERDLPRRPGAHGQRRKQPRHPHRILHGGTSAVLMRF